MGNFISFPFQNFSSSFKYEYGSNQIVDDFLQNVEKSMSVEDFLENFRKTKNYTEQIKLVKPFLKWNPPGQEFKCFFQKRDEISLKYSDILILSCREGCWEEAEQESNLAVCFAGTLKVLAVAYANRSILLDRLKDHEGALEEIQRALDFISDETQENEMRLKWIELQEKYKAILQSQQDVEEDLQEILMEDQKRRKLFCKELYHIKSPNPIAPAMDESLEIKFNPKYGRHLIATKDIPVGKTLLVEYPFVRGLNSTLDLEQAHCHHCLKKNLQCVPCPNCVFALFCDDNCMVEAFSYHKFECPCLPDLRSILTDQKYFDGVNFHLTFKLICSLGPKKLYEIFQQEKSCNEDPLLCSENGTSNIPKISGIDPKTGIYDSTSYLSINNLAAQFTPEKTHFHLAIFSLILTKILALNTNFFHLLQLDLIDQEEFMDFISKKILQHYTGIRINVFSLWELCLSSPGRSTKVTLEQSHKIRMDHQINLYARGVYPTASLMNHSCDPNVMLFPDLTKGLIAVVSVKPIKEGEEVTIFYCPPFSEQDATQRQQRLLTGYDFLCSCIACRDEWPMMTQGLNTRKKQFCCKRCSINLFNDQKSQEEMIKICLTSKNEFKCPTCGWQYNERDILNEFNRHKRALTVALRRVQYNQPLDALKSFVVAMEFFNRNICPPYAFGIFIQKFYIQAIQFIIHFAK